MTFGAGFEDLPKREQIIALNYLEIHPKEIAAILGFSKAWVYRVLKRARLEDAKR